MGIISLREKIGQMLIMGFEGDEVAPGSPLVKALQEDPIGGVILFDYNYQTKQFDKNIKNPEQVKRLNQQLQSFARGPHPLIISVDYEGGLVNRLKEDYGFPATMSAADVGKLGVLEATQVGEAMALTLKDAGFNLSFSPILDVNVTPDNPIVGALDRSFSSNPQLVAKYATIYADQLLQHGVQGAYKHFPGHGSSNADSHLGFVDVTNTWQSFELEPYQHAFASNNPCGMVMTAHIINRQLDDSGLPATLSHKILTGMLREELNFQGVIITDDMQMKAITDHYGLDDALELAIQAGADMFIFGNQLCEQPQDPKLLIDIIEAKVMSGKISVDKIDAAYKRIVAFKRTIS
jgi:beta-N-acetylhexosaminidase